MIGIVAPLSFIVLPLTFLGSSTQGRGWKGILPLHSTSADVEQRLGKPEGACNCLYRTANEKVSVDYAPAPCQGPPYGWNVPTNTVLQVTVRPKVQLTLSELALDESKYVKGRGADTPTVYYTSTQEGIKYSVYNGNVTSIAYIPSTKDKALRCEGFPDYDGGIREYHPYASFSTKAQMIEGRLDDLAFQLINDPRMKGYIITYAGKVSKKLEARTMAEKAMRHFTVLRKIPTERVTAIDGGFRETAEYELFLVPAEMPPPTPTPTVASNQVRIIGKQRKSYGRTRSKLARNSWQQIDHTDQAKNTRGSAQLGTHRNYQERAFSRHASVVRYRLR